jgi:iron complex transport system substrate-binding protein
MTSFRTAPSPPVVRRGRRGGRPWAAGIAAVVVLAACGSDSKSATTAASTAAPTTVAAAATTAATTRTAGPGTVTSTPETHGAFPVTITHKYGTTVIPSAPERVVTVGFNDQDSLLALGVVPIAIRDWYGDQPSATWPWAQAALGSAKPTVLPSDALNFEQIAALKPDLLVGVSSGMTKDDYDTLSKIAPTIAQPGEYVDYGTPWQAQTTLIGAAVGKPGEAATLISGIEADYAEVKAAHPEFAGKTAAVAFFFNDQPGAYSSQDIRSRLLSDLGFVIPKEYDTIAGSAFYASFSAEQISLLDVNALIWIISDPTGIAAIKASPLRNGLTALTEGREVFTDQLTAGAFSFSSPLSIPYLLDELVPDLSAAVDGDPATAVPSATAPG